MDAGLLLLIFFGVSMVILVGLVVVFAPACGFSYMPSNPNNLLNPANPASPLWVGKHNNNNNSSEC